MSARYDTLVAHAYLSLGSNVGDRIDNLRTALALLSPQAQLRAVSRVYETIPHGVEKQPLFYNLAAGVETDLEPRHLLDHLQRIEIVMGREDGTHNRPRPIDVDILFYEDLVIDDPDLKIPHPRLHERAFVLVPLHEIAPKARHPVFEKVIEDLHLKRPDDFPSVWLADEQL